MLQKIRLERFKCFKDLELPLAPLTLLTGVNGAGKSTVLSAIGLLHQSICYHANSGGLELNGPILYERTVGDLVNKAHDGDSFTLHVWDVAGANAAWTFDCSARESCAEPLLSAAREWWSRVESKLDSSDRLPANARGAEDKPLEALLQTLSLVQYLSADRMDAREDGRATSLLGHGVGPLGEHVASCLHARGDQVVDASRRLPRAAKTLRDQVAAHFQRFFPGADFQVVKAPESDLPTIWYRSHPGASWLPPGKAGRGFSQVLPIITACLMAEPGTVVLVENPETHLHPRSQSEMGLFLARMAAADVQLLVETHSDHLLNGLCLAVKRERLDARDAEVFFFDQGEEDEQPRVANPEIEPDGRIDFYPEHFFDQMDKDLMMLAGLEPDE